MAPLEPPRLPPDALAPATLGFPIAALPAEGAPPAVVNGSGPCWTQRTDAKASNKSGDEDGKRRNKESFDTR